MKISNWKNILLGLAVIILIVAADQVSKAYISNTFVNEQKNIIEVIKNFFYISYVTNTGAAWSLFSGNTFILVWCTGFLLLTGFVFMFFTDRIFLTVSVSMIVGGGLGNFIDRVFKKGVVDFLDFYIFGYDYPVFNIADVCLVCGTILLAIYILFLYKNDKPGFRRIKLWKK